jgi:amino acid transporter
MTTTQAPAPSPVIRKGLKIGALGLISSIVIGVASTAPAYSLAATLGFVSQDVGTKAPVIMLLAFVPMLFISYAYKALNQDDPDCGTSFTWVARIFGRHTGWLTGWVIVAADLIVMANLAEIAGRYTYSLFGQHDLADDTAAVTILGSGWIILMTLIAWVGIELSARTQVVLLSLELLILLVFAVVALAKVYAGHAGEQAIHPSLSWFNPFGGGLTLSALSAGFLLAVFIYWGWDSAVAANEETGNAAITPGRAAVLSTLVLLVTYIVVTVAAQAFAGVGDSGIGLANVANQDDTLSGIGSAALGTWGSKLLFLAVMSSAAASAQTTILPTARTTLSMAAYKALPRAFGNVHPKYHTPTVSTWSFGIVSIAFYGLLTWLSPDSLSDLIASIGLLIAFYYGLTGFASAWRFRADLRAGWKPALLKVVLPLLGGVILLAAFIKTAIDSYATDFGNTAPFGIGGVFLLGIGSIVLGIVLMIVWNLVAPAYFRGGTMRAGTVVTDEGAVVPAEEVTT